MKTNRLKKVNCFNLVLGISVVLASTMTGCKTRKPASVDSPSGTQVSSSSPILIGEVGSLTGSEATFGSSTHQGIQLAFEEVNAAGGIQGHPLQLVTLDDQSKPEEAATAATKLISQNQVMALLGEVASSRSIAMAPIAQNSKTPMISPSSTNPRVTQMGDYIFRVCFIDPFQGEVMAKFALKNLKVKKVAILRDIDSDYSTGLSDYFSAAFKKNGGQVLMNLTYSASDIDFKSQLTAIRAKRPEAILIPGYYTSVGLIARQARDLGIQVPLLGGDGWDSPKLLEIGGPAMENTYFSNHYSSESESPQVKEFVAKFKSRFVSTPDGMAAMGYDAAMILAQALKRTPSLSKSDLRDAIANTQKFQGVTGLITLNENRNAVKSAVVLKVAQGRFQYQTTIQP